VFRYEDANSQKIINNVPEGRNEGRRVATPTSFLISDSCDMKSLLFEFHYDIFTGLKMPRL
jgi:hypothetical protein